MKIILLKDVSKVGKRFDVKDVASGFAQNLLIPRGEAIAATPEAMKRVEKDRSKIEGDRKVQHELASKNLEAIEGTTLNIAGKASDKGHLFAGITAAQIVSELKSQHHIDLNAAFIELEHPIKEVGNHSINVRVGEKKAKLKVVVSSTK